MFSDDRSPATEATNSTEPPCSAIQARQASCTRPRRGDDVGVEDLAEGVEVEVDHRAVDRVDPDVADQHVQAAEGLDGRAHGLRAVLGVAGVAGHGDRHLRAAQRLDRLGQRLGLAGGDDHPGAPVDQALRDRQPDAPAAAGDQGGPSLHRAHACSSCSWTRLHGRRPGQPHRRAPAPPGEAAHRPPAVAGRPNRSHTRLRRSTCATHPVAAGRRRRTHARTAPPARPWPHDGGGHARRPVPARDWNERCTDACSPQDPPRCRAAPRRRRPRPPPRGHRRRRPRRRRPGRRARRRRPRRRRRRRPLHRLRRAGRPPAARRPAAARRRGRRRRRPRRPRRARRHPARPGRRPGRDRRLARAAS